MENFIEKLSKHKQIIAFGISAGIILFTFTFIFSLQNNNKFYLQDLEGDRNALSDLVITGYLQDKWHGQKIQIEKGRLSHKFEYYENEDDMHMPPTIYGNGAADDKYSYWYSYSYEIANDANTRTEYSEEKVEIPINDGATIEATEKITTVYADKIDIYMNVNINWLLSKDWKKGEPKKSRLKFKTGVSLIRDEMNFEFERKLTYYPSGGYSEQGIVFKNRDLVQPYYGDFALATLNGKQYFTVPNRGTELSGENGIFTAVEYVDIFTVLQTNTKEYGKVKKLVNFDLEEENIQVLGLHAVEDYLVSVMLINDILTFRAYDPNDGKLLTELAVSEFDIPNANKVTDTASEAGKAGNTSDWISYTPYINENTLSLSFVRLNSSYYQNGISTRPDYLSIVSVKLENVDNTDANANSINTNDATAGINHTPDIDNYTGITNIKLLHCINNFELNDMAVSSVSAVVPVGNKLVIFATLRSQQPNEVVISKKDPVSTQSISIPADESSAPDIPISSEKITPSNEFYYPTHFTIFVFGKSQDSFIKNQVSSEIIQNSSQLLYSGEIITDADDDIKTYRYTFRNSYSSEDAYQSAILSSGYNYFESRNIGLVTVKGAGNND